MKKSCNYKTLDQTGRIDSNHINIIMKNPYTPRKIFYPRNNFASLGTAYNNSGNGCTNGLFVRPLCGNNLKENFSKRSVIKPNSNIRPTKQYYPSIFGDYDNDGIVDVDDPNPFNRSRPDIIPLEQVSLSEQIRELINLRTTLNEVKDDILSELEVLGGTKVFGRTKTPFAIISKLRRKNLSGIGQITDLIAATVLAPDFNELETIKMGISNGRVGTVISNKNFYNNPLDGYRAIHYVISKKDKKGKAHLYELRLKTERMNKITELSEPLFKKKVLDVNYMKKIGDLAYKADKGDNKAIKEFDKIMSDKNSVINQLTRR